ARATGRLDWGTFALAEEGARCEAQWALRTRREACKRRESRVRLVFVSCCDCATLVVRSQHACRCHHSVSQNDTRQPSSELGTCIVSCLSTSSTHRRIVVPSASWRVWGVS